MTDADIKEQCETLFQSGHSRIQTYSQSGAWVRDFESVPKARAYKNDDERIFARRRINGKYAWKEFK